MAQETNGAYSLGRELKNSRQAACRRGWNKLRGEHGKMSVDFPNEAGLCQRFLSASAQSNFGARGQGGLFLLLGTNFLLACRGLSAPPVGRVTPCALNRRSLEPCILIRSPCYPMQNTRSKSRVPRYISDFGLWLSLVERLVRDQEAVGSNPTSPITTDEIETSSTPERSPRRQAVARY